MTVSILHMYIEEITHRITHLDFNTYFYNGSIRASRRTVPESYFKTANKSKHKIFRRTD